MKSRATATRLRERTGDLRVVQAALGHRQIATTEVYAAADKRAVRRAVAVGCTLRGWTSGA